jgi:hypothetical protein
MNAIFMDFMILKTKNVIALKIIWVQIANNKDFHPIVIIKDMK